MDNETPDSPNSSLLHSPNMEIIVLSELVNNPEVVTKVKTVLKDYHFHFPENRNIYKIIKTLSEEHQGKLDIIILIEYIKVSGITKYVNGLDYVNNLQFYSEDCDQIFEHIKFLDRCYRSRMLEQISEDAIFKTRNGEEPSIVVNSMRNAMNDVLPGNVDKVNMADILDKYWETVQKGPDFFPGLPLPGWANGFKFQLHEGIRRSTCAVIQAPSTNGKTTLAIQTAIEYADIGYTVLYLATEESEEAFGRRVAAYMTKTNNRTIRDEAHKWEQYKELESNWVREDPDRFIIYHPGEQWEEAEGKIVEYHNNRKIDVVVIDYIQRFKDGKGDQRVIELEEIARKALLLAHEMDCVMILVSQENDKGEAAWSTGIYKVVDIVWSIKFDKECIEGHDWQIKGSIKMKKNRVGDGQGEIDIWLVREQYTFYPNAQLEQSYYIKDKPSIGEVTVDILNKMKPPTVKPPYQKKVEFIINEPLQYKDN